MVLAVGLNIGLSSQAMAGGPIMLGQTFVSGTDRKTGKFYEDPHKFLSNNITPRTLNVYPGDKVTFYQKVTNLDPPIITATIIGNCAFPVAVSYYKTPYHRIDTNGETIGAYDVGMDTQFQSYPKTPIYPLYNTLGYVDYSPSSGFDPFCYGILMFPSNDKPYKNTEMTISGAGTDIPGYGMCQYVRTNPTVVDFLDFTLQPIVVGDHRFNTNKGSLIVPIPILSNLGISMPTGQVMSCVRIANNYNIMPSISVSDPTNPGTTPVSPSTSQGPVTNDQPTVSESTKWQIEQFYLPNSSAEQPDKITTSTGSNPCTYLTNSYGASSCQIPYLADGTTKAQSDGANTIYDPSGHIKSGTYFPSGLMTPTDVPDGYKVCYVLSISPYQQFLPANSWRHSKAVCVAGDTSKRPKVHVSGADVVVDGQIVTAQTQNNNVDALKALFGSWAEYASFSSGKATSFSTSSGLSRKDAGAPLGVAQIDINSLTFANAQETAEGFGFFASPVSLRGANQVGDLFSRGADDSSQVSTGDPVDLTDVPGRVTPYMVDNKGKLTLTIDGGDIAKSKTIIIVATGTVRITGDINYTSGELTSIKQIPQVVIIAHDINIAENVRNIDAWLITPTRTNVADGATPGSIDTCDKAKSTTLTSSVCDLPLTVNGPVVTDKLYLHRTAYGDDADPEKAAETFNSRGDNYLWAFNFLNTNYSLVTSNVIELPPRF